MSFLYKNIFSKNNLSTYIKTHKGEKPFKCNFCTNAFSQKNGLSSHFKTHTGENPFKCNCFTNAFPEKKIA